MNKFGLLHFYFMYFYRTELQMMSLCKLHPDFMVNNRSFASKEALMRYVSTQFPEHFSFLTDWFAPGTFVPVQTSGSTGKPKRILLEKSAMCRSAEATASFFGLPAKTKALHCLSSAYIAGKMMWVRALHMGWHLYVVPVDSNPMQHTEETFDFAAMIPLQARDSISALSRIKKLIIGGGIISGVLRDLLLKINGLEVYQTYGMTETITHIAVRNIADESLRYRLLPGIKISTDTRSCLVIDAPGISAAPIVTNDIVSLYDSHSFQWLGRYDHVINSGGVKLYPEQIEAKLSNMIHLPFFVAKEPDERLGERLILLVESEKPIEGILNNVAESGLSKFEIPKRVYFLKAFVYTETHKINRKQTLHLL